jgi:hypothetical protein
MPKHLLTHRYEPYRIPLRLITIDEQQRHGQCCPEVVLEDMVIFYRLAQCVSNVVVCVTCNGGDFTALDCHEYVVAAKRALPVDYPIVCTVNNASQCSTSLRPYYTSWSAEIDDGERYAERSILIIFQGLMNVTTKSEVSRMIASLARGLDNIGRHDECPVVIVSEEWLNHGQGLHVRWRTGFQRDLHISAFMQCMTSIHKTVSPIRSVNGIAWILPT